MDTYLSVRNLKKVYGKDVAVDGISFDIYPGEIVAFLGRNGAGKTTTVETVLGLRKRISGDIFYFGERVDIPKKVHLKRVGATLQQEHFLPNLTPLEILDMFRGIYGKGDVYKAISVFGIEPFRKKKYRHLSGGQKRRVSLAVATLHDPDLIFLDEPTTGLDVHSRIALHDYILKLKERGKSVFLTTHYIEEAEKLADRIIIIEKGKIIADGTLDELIKISGLKTKVKVCGNVYEITDVFQIKHIIAQCEDISDIGIRKPTLEDVFVLLTGENIGDDISLS